MAASSFASTISANAAMDLSARVSVRQQGVLWQLWQIVWQIIGFERLRKHFYPAFKGKTVLLTGSNLPLPLVVLWKLFLYGARTIANATVRLAAGQTREVGAYQVSWRAAVP